MTKKCQTALGECMEDSLEAFLRCLNFVLCGNFQTAFAQFTQTAMGAAACMSVYDAIKALQAGKLASGLISFGLALVQLPDVMGWLFGEIMKIQIVITFIEWVNVSYPDSVVGDVKWMERRNGCARRRQVGAGRCGNTGPVIRRNGLMGYVA